MQLQLLLIFVTFAFAVSTITTQSIQSRIDSAEETIQSTTESHTGVLQPRRGSRKGALQKTREFRKAAFQTTRGSRRRVLQTTRGSRKLYIPPTRESRKVTIVPTREFQKGTIQSSRNYTTENNFTCYSCIARECYNDPFSKTCDGGLSCYTMIEDLDGGLMYRKDCMTDAVLDLILCIQEVQWKQKQLTSCCKGDLCNNDKFPNYPPWWHSELSPEINNTKVQSEGISSTHAGFILPIVIGFVVTLVIITISGIIVHKKPNLHKPNCNDLECIDCKNCFGSDSRSGSTTSEQRSLASDITLIRYIGKGRYGEVWEGTWQGEKVAVKIFPTTDEASWKNEVNIYTNLSLHHENVLGFKGSDIKDNFEVTEMWLVTEFHEHGSLYDYLLTNTITHAEVVKFARSICAGLLHLHTEIVSDSNFKPAIAHRDLKTRNILLTSRGTCVIADFGLAIVKSEVSSDPHLPVNFRVGTKRYMAPEILDSSIKTDSFESYKRADIYAFGLVLWEICSRCTTEDAPYRPPFEDYVPSNPDYDHMEKVVCDELKRPEIPDSWISDRILNSMATLMKECWHRKPEARSSAHRLKRCLDRIHGEMEELQSTIQAT